MAYDSLTRRFVTGAFWSITGAVIARGATLAGMVMAGRILGVVGFGKLGLVQSTMAMFALLAGLGLGVTATREVAEKRAVDETRIPRVITLSLWVSVGAGLLFSLTVLLSAQWIARSTLGTASMARPLELAVPLLLFSSITGVQTGILTGLEEFRSIAVLSALKGAAVAVLVAVGAKVAGVDGAITGLSVAELLNVLANGRAIRAVVGRLRIRTEWRRSGEELSSLWRVSLPALLSSIAFMPAFWAAKVLLARSGGGYAQLGLFESANRWAQVILFIPAALAPIQLPMLANLHGANDGRAFWRLVRANLFANLAVCAIPAGAIAILARPLMAAYGTAYVIGASVLIASALATIPSVLNTVLGQVLIAAGRMWGRFVGDVVLALVTYAAASLLIPRYGASGLSIAMGCGYISASVAVGLLLVSARKHAADALSSSGLAESQAGQMMQIVARRTL